MSFVRHYVLESGVTDAAELRETLVRLRDVVADCPGSVRVDLFHAIGRPERLFFIEHWESKADHEAAGSRLPADIMAAMKRLLVAPPQLTDLVDAGQAVERPRP